jgi:hypothetical protein
VGEVGVIASKVMEVVDLVERKEGWGPCWLRPQDPAIWSSALASLGRVQAAHSKKQ